MTKISIEKVAMKSAGAVVFFCQHGGLHDDATVQPPPHNKNQHSKKQPALPAQAMVKNWWRKSVAVNHPIGRETKGGGKLMTYPYTPKLRCASGAHGAEATT